METWRVNVLLDNQSDFTLPETGSVGGTVISAPMGSAKPMYFAPGSRQSIYRKIGRPSRKYPQIWDVIEFNDSYPIYVSAPDNMGSRGGVHVTNDGVKQFVGGQDEEDFIYSDIMQKNVLAREVEDTEKEFTATLKDMDGYKAESVDIRVNRESINLSISEDSGTETLTGSGDYTGSGTLDTTSGDFSFTFDSDSELSKGDRVEVTYRTDRSEDVYFSIFEANPKKDDTAVKIETDEDDEEKLIIHFFKKDNRGNYEEAKDSPIEASLDETAKDGFGQSIYIEDEFENHDLFRVKVNDSKLEKMEEDGDFSIKNDITDDRVDFAGGDRGAAIEGTDYSDGYEYFHEANKYPVDVFFDVSAEQDVVSAFETLRKDYQKYSAYIVPLPNVSDSDAPDERPDADNRGIYFYWNWGKVSNPYGTSNRSIKSPLTGRIATKHADMHVAFNGMPPSWVDLNGLGGQLGSGIIELENDPDQETLKKLSRDNQINPIVDSPEYGVMLEAQRTSRRTLSDYSYINNSRTADYIIKNIVENVLPTQIGKLNNAQNRSRVERLINSILAPMTSAPYPVLRAYTIKCDEENNDGDVRNQRKFVVQVGVQMATSSEEIDLIFTNVDQETDVEEAVA